MTQVELPMPSVRPKATGTLESRLHARVDSEVRFDPGSLAAYSTDASNFRHIPLGVVVPRSVDAAEEALAVCREADVPVLSRGGATSLAGQDTNTAVIIDFSKYCNRLLSVDVDDRSCWVEPGIVLDELNRQLEEHGLRFGPEPATHNHCTLGGMIGNNSCGATAQRTGKTVDNTLALDVVLYDGTRLTLGETSDDAYLDVVQAGGEPARIYRELRRLRDDCADAVRAEYPHIPRRVSGYNLDSLLPENTFNLAQALVGSEGTCVMVLRAKLRLMPVVPSRTVVLLGYPDSPTSASDVPRVLESDPIALEGFDSRIISYQQAKGLNPEAIKRLPEGPNAWLLVQFGADTDGEAADAAEEFGRAAKGFPSHPSVTVLTDRTEQQQLWQVREAALGATAQVPGLPNMWSGWEDSAVGPDRLGEYLQRFTELLDEFGYGAACLYGHYGQGCVHTRIPFDLVTEAGITAYREFMHRAAKLVVELGGSLSGEHGDGQSRSELLPIMYGPEVIEAFDRFKTIFDPRNRMNPGILAEPRPLDANLRLGTEYSPARPETHFRFPHDEGSFDKAVLRCVGVGKCRRHEGGVMCPSYMVTREEEHSTRGRSRILFEMLQGHEDSPITDGWHSDAARDALDLCLACKGCKKDCPVNVDMATYKAEFLSHYYEGRLRPLAHYSMGWLPLLARVAALFPRALNAVLQAPLLSRVATAAAGVAAERSLPEFAPETFQSWYAARGPRGSGERGEVVLWPDTFNNSFHPHVAQCAVEVLEDAGWRVIVPADPVCCGLTWISTGQLAVAKRVLRRTVDLLEPYLDRGLLVLGLEPSCTAVFRSDAAELFPEDPRVGRLQEQTVTLAELLMQHSPGWQAPKLAAHALIQTHCHQHAVMGFGADLDLMRAVGIDPEVLDSGCCGLAGNFGFEKGHYEVSDACGERALFPALRGADESDLILADGFSCQTQIDQGDAGGRQGVHLAEVLAGALRQETLSARPENALSVRPSTPRSATWAALATAGLAAAGVAVGAGALLTRALRR